MFLVRHLEYVKINTEVQYQQVTVGPLSAESDASVSCQSVRVHLDPFVQAAGQHYPTDPILLVALIKPKKVVFELITMY